MVTRARVGALDRPSNARRAFAQRLRRLREERRISQATLAKLLGIGRSTVAQWERAATEPSLLTIEVIADILRVAPGHLAFGRGGEEEGRSSVKRIPLLHYSRDRKSKLVSELGLDRIFVDRLGLGEGAQLVAFKIDDDPKIEGIKRGDIAIIDTANKNISVNTRVAVWMFNEPKIAQASVVSSTGKPTARLSVSGKEYPTPLASIETLGRIVTIIHQAV